MKININGLTYSIIEVDDRHECLIMGDRVHFGMCDYKSQIIYLMQGVTREQKLKVLIHEITHAFLCSYGMYVKRNYNVEELCEFVAYNSKTIVDLAEGYFEEEGK